MIIFTSAETGTTMIINWEGGSHLELVIGPGSTPPRSFTSEAGQEIGTWDDPSPSVATVVEAEKLQSILSEGGPPQALPLVSGCQSQLVIDYNPDEDRLELWVLELYPPTLSPSVRLKASLVKEALFAK